MLRGTDLPEMTSGKKVRGNEHLHESVQWTKKMGTKSHANMNHNISEHTKSDLTDRGFKSNSKAKKQNWMK